MKFLGLLLVAASALLVAGCDSGSQADQYSAPGAVPAPAAPAAPAPPAAPPAAVPNIPPAVGRPMTAWEKQYKSQCESNLVANGCQFFTDYSLKLQGINPDS